MVTIKKKFKNINYSYVIGRFHQRLDLNFNIFQLALGKMIYDLTKKFKFDGTEWIISDFQIQYLMKILGKL